MDAPLISYWHIWTDEQGISHQTRCKLDRFEWKGIGAAAPQWNNHQPSSEAEVVFTVQPAGWVGEWHENPAPQWIVPLSGRWWVELSLGEDQHCIRDAAGRQGHRSGTIGDEPARLMTIRLSVPPVRRPCHFT